MPILYFVNCERTVLFSVKRDLDPPPFTTLICDSPLSRLTRAASLRHRNRARSPSRYGFRGVRAKAVLHSINKA